jgi:hypothetical protein
MLIVTPQNIDDYQGGEAAIAMLKPREGLALTFSSGNSETQSRRTKTELVQA